jgi:flagellar hook-associated protein 2
LDGVSVQLMGKAADAGQENIRFSVSADAQAMYQKLSDFVDDYNEIIDLITSKITEKQSTDEAYLPLTQEQKDEMTDDEIENWESEAKKGLLRNDRYLNNILSDMRSAMSSVVEGANTTLSKIGISDASYSWEENGKLYIDEDALKKAINSDAASIKALFLQQPASGADDAFDATGLAYRLQSVFKKNVNTLGTDGILIALAGAQNDNSDTDNTLSDNIADINGRLADLKESSRRKRKGTSACLRILKHTSAR